MILIDRDRLYWLYFGVSLNDRQRAFYDLWVIGTWYDRGSALS